MASKQIIQTPITDLLGITHPIMLAGMGTAAGPRLAAAVTNAGGIGVIGGIGYTPDKLREAIAELKSYLNDKSAPFGVDLLLPQVGGNARKTNYDYTKGHLDELITVIIETGTKLFVSAVGVPPKHVVDRLHAHGVLYLNMIGHPKHVAKCLERGVDIICAQGGEGGGHTGDVPTSILIPTVARLLKGTTSPLTKQEVQLVAAGGIYSGASLSAALMLGASAVWVGTRFVVAKEAGASRAHQEAVTSAGFGDTIRTIIFSGRPLRVRKNGYILNWEEKRQAEIVELTSKGILPVEHDADTHPDDPEIQDNLHPYLMGVCAAEINQVQSAAEIVNEMMSEAAGRLSVVNKGFKAKL
ncbi:2-nitropropane dioxygenase [Aspergillus egyptiacus]|nr:2-nitropropane dioxygenase [Aspergillus egyptiacus]